MILAGCVGRARLDQTGVIVGSLWAEREREERGERKRERERESEGEGVGEQEGEGIVGIRGQFMFGF